MPAGTDVLTLTELLDALDRPQRWLADRLGTSEVNVSRWANEKVNPEPETAERIGALTGTEPTFREGRVVFRVLPGGPKAAETEASKDARGGAQAEGAGSGTAGSTSAPSASPAPEGGAR